MLASAGAVRLNFRGVHTYSPSAQVRTGGWTGVKCNASAWSLCSSEAGAALPWTQPRMPEAPATVPAGWGGLGCGDGHGKVLVSLGVYDISACDIMDEGLDVVYSQGMLYHRHTSLPLWRYWVCVGLAIVLVRALSYNVQGLWTRQAGGRQPTHAQWPALVSSMCLLALVVMDGDAVYITKADQVFFWCAMGYVGFYLLVQLRLRATRGPVKKKPNQDKAYEQPVFNVIVGTLQVPPSSKAYSLALARHIH